MGPASRNRHPRRPPGNLFGWLERARSTRTPAKVEKKKVGERLPQPEAYQLFEAIVKHLQGSIRQLVIHMVHEHTFYAYLLIGVGSKTVMLDCRPSDGMVMARRSGAPIYVTPELLDAAGIPIQSRY